MTLRRPSSATLGIVPLVMLLALAAGFRGLGPGRDYLGYLDAYEEIRLSDSLDVLRFEPGYVLASWVSKFGLGLDFPIFASALAASALFIKLWLFSQYSRPILTILFYLCCWYPLHEYTQLRTAVALALCLFAAEVFFRGRYLQYALLMATAMSFHSSSLIVALAIPGAYLLSRWNQLMSVSAIIFLAFGIYVLDLPLISLAAQINSLSEAYSENLDGSRVNLLSMANLLTAGLLAAMLAARSLKDRRDATYFILAAGALVSAVVLQSTPVLSHRVKEALLIFLTPIAFSGELTMRSVPQYVFAATLAGWMLYSAVSQGILGASP